MQNYGIAVYSITVYSITVCCITVCCITIRQGLNRMSNWILISAWEGWAGGRWPISGGAGWWWGGGGQGIRRVVVMAGVLLGGDYDTAVQDIRYNVRYNVYSIYGIRYTRVLRSTGDISRQKAE